LYTKNQSKKLPNLLKDFWHEVQPAQSIQIQLSQTIVYMLQSTEYQVKPYFGWLLRTKDFSKVAKKARVSSDKTGKIIIDGLFGRNRLAIYRRGIITCLWV